MSLKFWFFKTYYLSTWPKCCPSIISNLDASQHSHDFCCHLYPSISFLLRLVLIQYVRLGLRFCDCTSTTLTFLLKILCDSFQLVSNSADKRITQFGKVNKDKLLNNSVGRSTHSRMLWFTVVLKYRRYRKAFSSRAILLVSAIFSPPPFLIPKQDIIPAQALSLRFNCSAGFVHSNSAPSFTTISDEIQMCHWQFK